MIICFCPDKSRKTGQAGKPGTCSFEVRLGDRSPEVMGEVADQQFVDQVDGPEDIMDDQQEDRMVVMPAYQERIDTEDTIEDA
jgi:hypothetical protein